MSFRLVQKSMTLDDLERSKRTVAEKTFYLLRSPLQNWNEDINPYCQQQNVVIFGYRHDN